MSEKLSSRSEEEISSAWDSYQADAEWLEEQRKNAEANGDQATIEKANAGIAFDRAAQEQLLAELDGTQEEIDAANQKLAETGDEVQEKFPSSNADVEDVTMEESQSQEKQADSRAYSKTFVSQDGTVETITGSTPEELQQNIQKYQANIVSRRA